ncbi:MAG: MarR family winged helix-turn-helix transcriptional regulator [Candidatus Palauibacterales bacterium]|nr:MarR family winged helix-turn-helix transcriptional regulator [Candidatus Palauibacterales bacterium]MDP2530642.1 MarR family winged helix-turn-helix transcriptional regulator [Candidatus Palauibacterales bacterium]MDP2583559.1 MarR family winged helix-turn-helix transcriptional regulator [Candidatus Palauibacterales bacterium]
MTMRLQDEIKQSTPFTRPEVEALLSVLRTSALLDHALGQALKPFGLTHTQYNVLRILRGAGKDGLCGREVGERLVSPVPDVSRLLDRLSEVGLVERHRDPGDRRHVRATLTAEGERTLERATPALEELQTRWFGDLDRDRLRALIRALGEVRSAG